MSDKAIALTEAQETAGQLARRMFYKNVPNDVATAALLVCNRYGLDPLLKHIVLMENKKNKQYTIYITRDGLLHNAHHSGQLDGMNVVFGKDDSGVWAECTVYRKDMRYPFVYRVYASEYQGSGYAWSSHPRAMLTKTAEVFSLRRAFNIALPVREEMDVVIERDDLEEVHGEVIEGEIVEDDRPTPPASKKAAPADDDPVVALKQRAPGSYSANVLHEWVNAIAASDAYSGKVGLAVQANTRKRFMAVLSQATDKQGDEFDFVRHLITRWFFGKDGLGECDEAEAIALGMWLTDGSGNVHKQVASELEVIMSAEAQEA